MDNKAQMIAFATQKMIEFYKGNLHDIDHFLKVWALAKTIGTLEKLDDNTQEILEIAAIVHDIACPLCREKYGNTNGKKQEMESPPLVKAFFADFSIALHDLDRISWLVAHHHTYTDVDGIDHQILLEADYLVNAGESAYSMESVRSALRKVFCTETGKRLLREMLLCGERQEDLVQNI